MADWEEIDLTLFKLARYTTNIPMAHFITKFMSNKHPVNHENPTAMRTRNNQPLPTLWHNSGDNATPVSM